MKAKFIKENIGFERGHKPKDILGVGLSSKIDSNLLELFNIEILSHHNINDDLSDGDIYAALNNSYRIEFDGRVSSEDVKLIIYLWELFKDNKIENGAYFEDYEEEKMKEYLKEEADGRYIYDAWPEGDGWSIIFSEIQFPNADEIIYN